MVLYGRSGGVLDDPPQLVREAQQMISKMTLDEKLDKGGCSANLPLKETVRID